VLRFRLFLGDVVEVEFLGIGQFAFLLGCSGCLEGGFFVAGFALAVMVVRSIGGIGIDGIGIDRIALLASETCGFPRILRIGSSFACLLGVSHLAGKVEFAQDEVSRKAFIFAFVGFDFGLILI
jgi:hypothetical protein